MKKLKVLLCMAVACLALSACAGGSTGKADHSNDKVVLIDEVDLAKKLFPDLEGIESTEFEQIVPAGNDRLAVGPSDYIYQGYIVLSDEMAEKYESSYVWTEDEKYEFEVRTITERKGDWQYSEDFSKDYMPDGFTGRMWLDGNVIRFWICTM
ncbi:hypothetical protein [Butyrivibrio proteoclasticus]|uniref:hypothetical protein n=1 Tax=Butyrivibrio proteoclasticus TaxID=43305 RepID=UPI00047D3461|nr:hypothetical protein [Butyrivibrio proteoclasticus]